MSQKLGIILKLFILLAIITMPVVAEKTSTSLTDILGREVTLDLPVDNIALQSSGSGGPFFTLFALEGENAVSKIAAIDKGLKENRYDIWEAFSTAIPELKSIPIIGNGKDLNPESIISINPNVMVVPKDEYNNNIDNYKKIEEAGIPIVTIDFHDEKLENHKKSIELMGQILGKEEKATELFDYYQTQLEKVTAKLSTISKPEPRVLDEWAMDYNEIGLSSSPTYMWGSILNAVDGNLITEGVLNNYGTLSEEYIMKSNPEVIVFIGSYWENYPNSFRLGFLSDEQTAKDTLKPYLAREGWDAIEAVKNNQVYGANGGVARDITDFSAFQLAAKALYPEEFTEINPEENLRDFYDKYMPFKLYGKWFLEPSE